MPRLPDPNNVPQPNSYKHAKYLMRVKLIERFDQVRGGRGGYWEDRGYQWYAGI